MSIQRAKDLFSNAAYAARDGDCDRAKRLYRKGLTVQRQAVKRGGGSYIYQQMFDARFVARTILRRGCFYMSGRRA